MPPFRAMEQLQSRALGKPKETVAHETEDPEVLQELRALAPEEHREQLQQWNRPQAAET
jgi:hypothetical protein